jgi:hypothetical protein
LDRLRIELRLQGQLQGLDLKPGLVQQLLKQRSTSNAEVNELRLDLSPMKQASVLVRGVHGLISNIVDLLQHEADSCQQPNPGASLANHAGSSSFGLIEQRYRLAKLHPLLSHPLFFN